MICTGAGVSVSVRLIKDPVTTISCNSVLADVEEFGACCAPAVAANRASPTAVQRDFVGTMEGLIRRRGALACVGCMKFP